MREVGSSRRPLGATLHSLPQQNKLRVTPPVFVILCGLLFPSCRLFAQTPVASAQIEGSDLDRQVRSFLQSEVAAHVADIKPFNPPPDPVLGPFPTSNSS